MGRVALMGEQGDWQMFHARNIEYPRTQDNGCFQKDKPVQMGVADGDIKGLPSSAPVWLTGG